MSDNRALARTAASQFGLLNLAQNRAGGVSASAVSKRRANGRYERMARGVDAIAGTPSSWQQKVVAAWLAAGEGAVVSHRTAAQLWGIGTFDGIIELTTRYERAPVVPGVVVHRSLDLDDADFCMVGGIWATSIERTLVDIGAVVPVFLVERLVERAVGRGLTTPLQLRATLDRVAKRGRRGAGRLRTVLDTRALGDSLTESELEEIFARVCRDRGLPIPQPQVWVTVGGRRRRLDFAYVDRRIAIEVNGYEPHTQRDVYEDDHVRRNSLNAAGWRVIEFTRHQLLRRHGYVGSTLSTVLCRKT